MSVRSFNIMFGSKNVGTGPIVPVYGKATQVVVRDVVASSSSQLVFQSTINALLPPMINALELYIISSGTSGDGSGNGSGSGPGTGGGGGSGGGGGGGSGSGGPAGFFLMQFSVINLGYGVKSQNYQIMYKFYSYLRNLIYNFFFNFV